MNCCITKLLKIGYWLKADLHFSSFGWWHASLLSAHTFWQQSMCIKWARWSPTKTRASGGRPLSNCKQEKCDKLRFIKSAKVKYLPYALLSEKTVTEDQLVEVCDVSAVMEAEEDYLEHNLRQRCEAIIPNPQDILPCDCAKKYLLLKRNFEMSTQVWGHWS